MSRIRRVRVVNVGHEDAYYPDVVLEFEGHDTLVCLANGGGKTTLLHHLLQVVRPGAQIDRRRIRDYFGSTRRTVHVAIEFLLDEKTGPLLKDDPPLLLAGICFERRPDAEGLDRLTYTCEYPVSLVERVEGRGLIRPDDPPTLGTLPVTFPTDGGRRVATLRELRQALRANPHATVYRADQGREYEDKLRSYHIERETWEGMVRINRVEGGLKHYFDAVNTVEKLVRFHFLPAVVDPAEEANLREAVRQVAESAAELPRLEEDVRVCEAYLERFAALRRASAKAHEAARALEAAAQDAAQRAARLVGTSRAAAREEEAAARSLEEARAGETRARARLEAFQIQAEKASLDAARREADRARRAVAEQEERHEAARRARVEVEALDLAVCNLRDRALLAGLAQKRAAAAADHRELEAAWEESASLADGALEQALGTLAGERDRTARERAELEERRRALLERRSRRQAERARLAEALGRRREWLRAANDRAAELADLLAGRSPLEAAEALEAEAAEALDRAAQAEQEAEGLKARAEARLGECTAEGERAARFEARVSALEEKLAEHATAMAEVGPVLARWGAQPDLPYREQAAALRAVAEAEGVRRDRLLRAEARRARARREQAFLEDEGFPLPNEDLLRVREALEEAGIPTSPAARWLREIPETARRAVLGRWPFAAHALLAEGTGAWRAFVERGAEVLASLDLRSPVPVLSPALLDRAVQGAAAFDPVEGAVVVLDDGAGFPLPRGAAALWDPGAFQELAARAHTLAEEAQAELDRARRALDEVEADRRTLDRFYEAFPETRVEGWRRDLDRARARAEAARRRCGELKDEADRLRAEAEALAGKALGLRDRARQAAEDAARLRRFWEVYGRRLAEAEAAEVEETRHLEALAAEIEALDARIQTVDQEIRALFLRDQALEYRESRLREARADLAAPATRRPPRGADLEQLLARARAARENLHRVSQEVQDLDEHIASLRRTIGERTSRIQALGMEEPAEDRVAALSETWDPVSARRDAQARLEAARAELAKARGALEAARDRVNRASLRLEKHRAVFRERYGAEPEAFEDPTWPRLNPEERARVRGALTSAVARASRAVRRAEARWAAADRFRKVAEGAAARARAVQGWESIQAEPLADPEAVAAELKALERVERERDERAKALQRAERGRDRALAAFVAFLETDALRLAGRLNLSAEDAQRALATHDGVERYFQVHARAVEDFRRSALAEKDRLEREKAELTERCEAFGRRLADEIRSIQRYSTVRFSGGKARRLLQVDLALRDEAAARSEAAAFLQRFVDAYGALPEGERASFAARAVTAFELVRTVARMDRARVRIFKPKTPGAPARYSDWEDVRAWSGGEKQVACYLLFVATLTYATYRAAGREDATKVLLLDNPVGEASSAHLLRVMVELARENAIQLIVLTAHQDPGIWKYFRNLISLVLVPTSRRTYVQVDRETTEAFRARFELEEATLLATPHRDWEEDFAEG